MNTKEIHIFNNAGQCTDKFISGANKIMRAIIGKHGELRIMEVETLEDADIETKQQLENIIIVCVIHSGQWSRYENKDAQ